MSRPVAATLALLLTGCATTRGERLYIAAVGLDAATTAVALHQGAEEANPLINWSDDELVMLASFTALNLAAYAIIQHVLNRQPQDGSGRLPEEQREKTWKALAAMRGGVAAWNLKVTMDEKEEED